MSDVQLILIRTFLFIIGKYLKKYSRYNFLLINVVGIKDNINLFIFISTE